LVNGQATDYDGLRDSAGIVDWIKSITGPAVIDGGPSGKKNQIKDKLPGDIIEEGPTGDDKL